MTRLSILGLALGFAIFLAACGTTGSTGTTGGTYGAGATASSTPAPTQTPAATPASTPTPVATPAPAASVIVSQNMALGAILTNAGGRTLYIFLPEKGGHVVCAGACLTYWPAATGNASAGTGVSGNLAVITRPDGTRQLSYNTWPLYFFAGDSGPDQTNGQGVVGFGGKWLVATPGLQA